jgi:preprotein translocase subunit SecG
LQALVITIHVLACVFLIILVLLQSGKEDMGVIFGGGSSSVFGSSGAGGLLVKLTALAAGIFLVTSLVYNTMTGPKATSASIMDNAAIPSAPAEAPKKPAGVEFEKSEAKPAETGAPAAKKE